MSSTRPALPTTDRRLQLVGAAAVGLSLTLCLTGVPVPSVGAVAGAAVAASNADRALASMSEAQRVGQLFMVGTPAASISSQTVADISTYHAGNVILTGRSTAGVSATASISASLQAKADVAATAGVPLFISADQEGGNVQVLSGTGFSSIPTALTQGGYATSTLRADAQTWGAQLRAAGVNVDLAPVLDTVPSAAFAPRNPRSATTSVSSATTRRRSPPRARPSRRVCPTRASTRRSSTSRAWGGSPRIPTTAPVSPIPRPRAPTPTSGRTPTR